MDKEKIITSLQNPLVKKVLQLKEKSRERKKSGLFIIEGLREIQLAQKGGYTLETLLHCEEINSVRGIKALEQIAISKAIYEKLAYRQTTEGILAIVKAKNHSLDTLKLKSENPLLLVAEAPEKPGNIGALLRTADAANLDAVLIANPKSDLYNPNIIRSSVGCVFTNEVGMGSTEEIISF